MSLKLVEHGLTNAVMFSPKEEVLQPSEVLYNRYCQTDPTSPTPGLCISEHPLAVNLWINATNLQVKLHLRNLYAHLLENHYVTPVVGYDTSLMDIFSRDILAS